MGNSLMNYLDKRLKEGKAFDEGKNAYAGPVITISREVGCNGIKLANLLASRLNKTTNSGWKVLSKEVFYESAKELDLEPEKLRRTFKKSDKYIFEEILKAFGDKRFKSEVKIANTVRDVVRTLAEDGCNIIVGRASHIIAKDIEKSIHLRLTAPLDYRLSNIMKNNGLTKSDALAFIEKVEHERMLFRKTLKAGTLQEELFDLTINRASFSSEQAIEIILQAIEQKKILSTQKQKMMFF